MENGGLILTANDRAKTTRSRGSEIIGREIIHTVTREPKHITGTYFSDCCLCDEEIGKDNPGKAVHYEINGMRYVDHVCNSCFIRKYINRDIIKILPL